MWFTADINETRYGPSRRNSYIIHYVLSGKGYFNGNEVKKGEGFLKRPEEFEHYYADEKDPWSYLWIISNDSEMEYFFTKHNANAKTGIFKFRNEHVIENVRKALERAKNGVFLSPTIRTEYFLTIFNNCIYSNEFSSENSGKLYFNYSVNYIDANLHLPLTVDTLCSKTGVSQPYLYKIFKQEVGVSPKQYVLEKKLNRAEKLLISTSLTISEIAMEVGFADVLAFSKFFTKRTGASPTDFRKINTKA
jgi:AraC family transcriptional regulator of arabinose operon